MDIFSNDKEINNDLKRLANDDLKRTTFSLHNTIIGDQCIRRWSQVRSFK